MGDKSEANLLLAIYDLVFGAKDPGVFNDIAEKVVIFLKAFSCSLWINNFRAIETETRLGYYSSEDNREISQLDYDISYKTMTSKEVSIDKITDEAKNRWFYASCPFETGDLSGCYTIWFKNGCQDDFREGSQKVLALTRLSDVIKSVVSHFLRCNRFNCKRIIQELGAAQKIQGSLIPTENPKLPNVSIGARNLVANEVGGDYLDIIQLDNQKLGIAVGDAMGMGIPGAFVMLTTRAVFRLLARARVGPEVILRQLNICLTPELIQQNMFISLFYGIYDPQTRDLQYAVAGHNPPIIFRRSSRKVEDLGGRGLIIGGKHQTTYNSYSSKLEKGDIIIVYTDGVKDIKNNENKQFGIDGIKTVLLNYAEYDAEGIGNCLAHALIKYCDNKLSDDASFIILKAE